MKHPIAHADRSLSPDGLRSSSTLNNSAQPLIGVCIKAALIASVSLTAVACSQSSSEAHPEQAHTTATHASLQSDAEQTHMQHQDHGAMTHMDMNSHEPAEALGQDYSIYQVGGEWTDHKGRSFELDNLQGKNQVVVMAYTSCQHTCPILVRAMKQIEKEMSDEARAETEFVLATLDTERDTVEVMNNYAEHNELGDQWRLIRSNEANTRMLANTLNIKYQFADNGDINHSNLISILDKQGRLVAQEIGVADSGIHPLIDYLNTHY
ncbi:SCO family protein [Psychrobacter sp. FDAARGOS_221]|uniref:SCO family protein n=1 Tax=Psychrobacter sp. FDAARGOS_221 TaxID=1975705 RepID=UPI000BB57EDC|nr:SCO family protein [Psychrobacter sp. FDAARGOS_221]PNK60091.1 SCO family protein [Psychrobacter sp. FDAARGOS_221]